METKVGVIIRGFVTYFLNILFVFWGVCVPITQYDIESSPFSAGCITATQWGSSLEQSAAEGTASVVESPWTVMKDS